MKSERAVLDLPKKHRSKWQNWSRTPNARIEKEGGWGNGRSPPQVRGNPKKKKKKKPVEPERGDEDGDHPAAFAIE